MFRNLKEPADKCKSAETGSQRWSPRIMQIWQMLYKENRTEVNFWKTKLKKIQQWKEDPVSGPINSPLPKSWT